VDAAPLDGIEQLYALEKCIGRGAFGEVYRGSVRATGQPVAIKRMLHRVEDPLVVERFDREARLLARVDSPYVVRYVDHGTDREGRPCLVIEWLEGVDLAAQQNTTPLSAAEILQIVQQAAMGLDALHRAGIVHRDVKPSNFFLERTAAGPRVKLLDLGIARDRTEVALTLEGDLIGTPSYMSPEQARGEGAIGPASDVFSLGVVTYELLSGRRPFAGQDPFAVLAKIVLEDPPRLGSVVQKIPPALDAIVARALAKNPIDRFATARAFADAIAALPPFEGWTAAIRDEVPTAQLRSLSRGMPIERRVVTAIFAGFSGAAVADEAMEQFEQVVARHGGTAHRTLGRRMVAVFGVARSSGDEAVRAARAALATRAKLPAVRLSVATGRAMAGNAGLSGDAIDRGARDVDRAGIEIRIDDATARLLAADFVVEPHEGRTVLRTERAASNEAPPRLLGRETPLVGRDREMELLEDVTARAIADRRASAIVLTGPPGIGKSRLRFEALARVHREHPTARTWIVRGDPMLGETPLGALSRALRIEARVDNESDPKVQQGLVRAFAARIGLAGRAAILGELMRVEFDTRKEPELAAARSDPGSLRAQLREVFTAVLASWARTSPVVLAIDDLQWLDRATLDAIAWALDALSDEPLVVMAFGRPESREIFPDLWSAASPQFAEIGPLTDRASEALVRAILGGESDAAVVRSLVSRGMGNPLFLEELLRARANGEDGELPIAIQAAFQIRLDALAVATKRIALVASVFGMAVWREALQAIAPEIAADVALGALVHAEILAERPRSRFAQAREYTFRHSLLRDAAYSMLSPDELGNLHRAAALWLGSAGERDDGLLARHFELGGDRARAAEHYLAAARRAARESSYEIALAHARRGITLAADDEVSAGLHLVAATVCHPLGHYADAIEHGERALALTHDAALRLELVATRGLTLRRVGRPEQARDELVAAIRETEAHAHEANVRRARSAAILELAWNDHSNGYHRDAITRARTLLADMTHDEPGFESLVLSAHHVLGRSQHGAGLLEDALASHRAAVERATALGHRWRGEGARYGLGQVLLALGQNSEAKHVLETAARNARALALPSTEGYALFYLGWSLARLGRSDEARRCEREAAAIGASLHAPALEGAARAMGALFAYEAGDEAETVQLVNTVFDLPGVTPAWYALAEGVAACVAAARGEVSDAEARIDAVLARLDLAVAREDIDAMTEALVIRALHGIGADARAEARRAAAVARLESQVALVANPALQHAMRDGIPEHRALVEG
jgi:tetratricopeptide (TPR) repeat protein/tRNA A-37 threonylcarbamoyl transferase component Bud32